MDYRIPGVLKTEHEELYEGLNRAARAGGDVGDAATLAFRAFQPHARKEEEMAFPPLDLLPSLAEKGATTEVAGMIKVCDRLRKELHTLLREHEAMRKSLEEMNEAAMREQKPEYAALAKRIMHHVMLEEHVLYPAAMLVGEHIKAVLYGPPATVK